MSKTINKGRDFYRALQAKNKFLASRVIRVDEDGALSDRRYELINATEKTHEIIGANGKSRFIPYTTYTYVRDQPSI